MKAEEIKQDIHPLLDYDTKPQKRQKWYQDVHLTLINFILCTSFLKYNPLLQQCSVTPKKNILDQCLETDDNVSDGFHSLFGRTNHCSGW